MTPEELAVEFDLLSQDATRQAKSLPIGNMTGIAYQNGRTWAWAESAKSIRQHLTPSDPKTHPAYAQGRADLLAEQAADQRARLRRAIQALAGVEVIYREQKP